VAEAVPMGGSEEANSGGKRRGFSHLPKYKGPLLASFAKSVFSSREKELYGKQQEKYQHFFHYLVKYFKPLCSKCSFVCRGVREEQIFPPGAAPALAVALWCL